MSSPTVVITLIAVGLTVGVVGMLAIGYCAFTSIAGSLARRRARAAAGEVGMGVGGGSGGIAGGGGGGGGIRLPFGGGWKLPPLEGEAEADPGGGSGAGRLLRMFNKRAGGGGDGEYDRRRMSGARLEPLANDVMDANDLADLQRRKRRMEEMQRQRAAEAAAAAAAAKPSVVPGFIGALISKPQKKSSSPLPPRPSGEGGSGGGRPSDGNGPASPEGAGDAGAARPAPRDDSDAQTTRSSSILPPPRPAYNELSVAALERFGLDVSEDRLPRPMVVASPTVNKRKPTASAAGKQRLTTVAAPMRITADPDSEEQQQQQQHQHPLDGERGGVAGLADDNYDDAAYRQVDVVVDSEGFPRRRESLLVRSSFSGPPAGGGPRLSTLEPSVASTDSYPTKPLPRIVLRPDAADAASEASTGTTPKSPTRSATTVAQPAVVFISRADLLKGAPGSLDPLRRGVTVGPSFASPSSSSLTVAPAAAAVAPPRKESSGLRETLALPSFGDPIASSSSSPSSSSPFLSPTPSPLAAAAAGQSPSSSSSSSSALPSSSSSPALGGLPGGTLAASVRLTPSNAALFTASGADPFTAISDLVAQNPELLSGNSGSDVDGVSSPPPTLSGVSRGLQGLATVAVQASGADSSTALDLNVGDPVVVFEVFADGTVFGANIRTRTGGLMPLSALRFIKTEAHPDGAFSDLDMSKIRTWKLARYVEPL
ncbi:hypothetical protein DFJ73DRAFT_773597 [Zopfochytrium polystomum]|nr:hypothetical protein DFJ73DRAFT_773597 [Zopfochytrium polystomum]